MRIGVLSDTHDHLGYLRHAVDALCDLQVELVLHAGDYVAPFVVNELQRLPCRVLGIFGNNDGERVGLTRRLSEIGQVQPLFLELAGCRIAMVHEPEPVEAFARSGLYDLVIYGHTHQQELRTVGECLVLNPGEVCGWLTDNPPAPSSRSLNGRWRYSRCAEMPTTQQFSTTPSSGSLCTQAQSPSRSRVTSKRRYPETATDPTPKRRS